jgi:hypothetical protein
MGGIRVTLKKIDPAIEIMLKQNITEAFTDASSANRKIDVLPAEDGEPITEYIKEITDDEAVELLEGIYMSEEDRQLRLQVNKNAEAIEKQTLELNKVIVTMAGGNGVKGYVGRTEEAITDLKNDIHEGFASQNKKWSDFENILMDMVKEMKKDTKENCEIIRDHEVRLKALEEEKHNREANAKFLKRSIIGAALGGSGVTGLVFAVFKGWIK